MNSDDDDDATIQKIICENQQLKKECETLKKELHQQKELVSTFCGSNEKLLKEVAILRDANLQLQESESKHCLPTLYISFSMISLWS